MLHFQAMDYAVLYDGEISFLVWGSAARIVESLLWSLLLFAALNPREQEEQLVC